MSMSAPMKKSRMPSMRASASTLTVLFMLLNIMGGGIYIYRVYMNKYTKPEKVILLDHRVCCIIFESNDYFYSLQRINMKSYFEKTINPTAQLYCIYFYCLRMNKYVRHSSYASLLINSSVFFRCCFASMSVKYLFALSRATAALSSLPVE